MTLSDAILLTLFGAIVSAGLLIVYSTVRTGMSPMPSSRSARLCLLDHLRETPLEDGAILDIGSGWGHLVVLLARDQPGRHVIGYEQSLLPFAFSRLWVRWSGLSNADIRRGNFFRAWRGFNSAGAAWVTYLHRPAMQQLADGFASGLPAPAYLFSNNFSLPGETPDARWQQEDFFRSFLYRYQLNHYTRTGPDVVPDF